MSLEFTEKLTSEAEGVHVPVALAHAVSVKTGMGARFQPSAK